MEATWLMNETVATGVFINPQGLQYDHLSFSHAFRLWQPPGTTARKIPHLGEHRGFFRTGRIEARGRGSVSFKVTERAGGRTRNSAQKLLRGFFSVFPFLSPCLLGYRELCVNRALPERGSLVIWFTRR